MCFIRLVLCSSSKPARLGSLRLSEDRVLGERQPQVATHLLQENLIGFAEY